MANAFLNFVTFFVSCLQSRMNVVYIQSESAVIRSLQKIKEVNTNSRGYE